MHHVHHVHQTQVVGCRAVRQSNTTAHREQWVVTCNGEKEQRVNCILAPRVVCVCTERKNEDRELASGSGVCGGGRR